MAKNFVLISVALACILLQTTQAASFECADEPAVCKTTFATQFENGSKDLHLAGIRKFITAYTEIGNTIKSEFPANSPLAKYTDDHINLVNNALEKIHGNVGDVKKFAEAFNGGLRALSGGLENIAEADKLKEIAQKHDFTHTLVTIFVKVGADTGNLWAEMYTGLRETDLKTYPEYAEVNVYMENLRGNGEREAEPSDFMEAAEILGTKFNLPYFAEVSEIQWF